MTKLSGTQLQTTIREMVKTELRSALKERSHVALREAVEDPADVNPIFSNLRGADKKAMVDWVMRYFFSPKKKDQPWWSSKVNAENVLAYVSNPKSGFPLTPKELMDDWKIKKSLKSDLAAVDDAEIDAFHKNAPEAGVYSTGERTLKDIGNELGGLTPAMIDKIEKTGMEKFVKIMAGQNPMNMDEEELDQALAKVEEARQETSLEFANDLKAAKGNIKNFISILTKKMILAPTDVKLMEPREVEMLMFLMGKPVEQVAEYLRGDARKPDNKIKSFQAAVARKLFPAGRRGRPKKVQTT